MRSELNAFISQMHEGGILYVEAVREFRKAFIATVLLENDCNQSKAARELGMHRNTLAAWFPCWNWMSAPCAPVPAACLAVNASCQPPRKPRAELLACFSDTPQQRPA